MIRPPDRSARSQSPQRLRYPGRQASPSKLSSELCHCSFIPLLPPAPPSLHNSVTLCTMYELHEWTYYGDCIQMLLTKPVIQHKPAVNHYAGPFRVFTYAGGVSVKRVNNSIVCTRLNSKSSLYQEAPPPHTHTTTEVSSPTRLRITTVPRNK